MKIRTVDELDNRIQGDLTWRRHEMQFFDQQIHAAGPIAKRSLLRASTTLLYAHWEGFIKTACHYYLCYISSLKLEVRQLSPELAALSLRTSLLEASASNSPQLHADMVRGIRESAGEKSKIPTKRDAVKTRSNLSFQVLEQVLASVGVNSEIYSSSSDLINDQLVESRNKVAHGENDHIASTEWAVLQTEIFTIMESIATQLVNNATTKKYLAISDLAVAYPT
ncbi:MAE_28990/MAE_18760 family HEPN-like nuclease [Rhodococcus baikonurensis]|uniref:MAE_28990/MAE_18760 family HEPN-like nuclease n=1 Tax=Rhodococcus baikonurensis TaxID=172041 RepID=UPI003791560A